MAEVTGKCTNPLSLV